MQHANQLFTTQMRNVYEARTYITTYSSHFNVDTARKPTTTFVGHEKPKIAYACVKRHISVTDSGFANERGQDTTFPALSL